MNAQNRAFDQPPPNAFGIGGAKKLQVLAVEVFVALAMAVSFFFLVRTCFISGDPINRYIFTSASKSLYRLDQPLMGSHWNGRLGGLLLSGALADFSLDNPRAALEQDTERLASAFAFYHAFWVFLLFVAIIFALQDALLVNLGIFAGLMYDFSPISGPYFYPWDTPAMFFFTIAVLFFERRRLWLMTATICLGCFFKETVLVCALLLLFAEKWPRGKRIVAFGGIFLLYAGGKQLLLDGLHLQSTMASVGDATSLSWVFSPTIVAGDFLANLRVIFSPTLNSVLFANAGTLVAVLALCWQKRWLPCMTVIIAYLAGLMLVPLSPPGVTEVRVFMQILPLSVILLSEWRNALSAGSAEESRSAVGTRAWGMRGTFSLLVPMTLLVAAVCIPLMAWRYAVIAGSENAYVRQLNLARAAMKTGNLIDALDHEEKALALNPDSVEALNNVAWLRAAAPDPGLRNGDEAVRLAQRACELTRKQEAVPLCTLSAAYAETGRFDDAISAAKAAIELAQGRGQTNIVEKTMQFLQLYQAHQPYREQTKQ